MVGTRTIPGAVNAVITSPIWASDAANGPTRESSYGETSPVPSGRLSFARSNIRKLLSRTSTVSSPNRVASDATVSGNSRVRLIEVAMLARLPTKP
jgi:hypothetical protein